MQPLRSDADGGGTVYYVSTFFTDGRVTADDQATGDSPVTAESRSQRLPPIEVVRARIAYRMRYLRGMELLDNHQEFSDLGACTCGRPSPCELAAEGQTLATIYESWAPTLHEQPDVELANADPSTSPAPAWALVRPYVLPRQRQGGQHINEGASDDA